MSGDPQFFLRLGVSYSVGNDCMARPKCNVPIASMTVEVSEQTYRQWFHDAFNIPVDPLFSEPLDDNWWTSHAANDMRLSVAGHMW